MRRDQRREFQEREARRARFAEPFFDFAHPHKLALAAEAKAREERVQARTKRFEAYLSTKKTSSQPPAADDSINVYEAMYVTKGQDLSPDDFADAKPITAGVRDAMNKITSIIRKARDRRLTETREEPEGTHSDVIAQREPENRQNSLSLMEGYFPCIAVVKVPWFKFLFREGVCAMASGWRRQEFPLGDSTVPTDAIMTSFAQIDFEQRLHEEMLAFVTWADLTIVETEERKKILANMCVISQALWPDCQLAPFGSFFNGLSLPGADIDVCVLNVQSSDANIRNCIHDLARLLRMCPFARDVTAVTKARVPIVKFRDHFSDLQVDLTINQESAIDTSSYIHERMLEWHPLRPLILTIKLLLREHDLNETYKGGVGSYMLFNMVVHHLQEEAKAKCKRLGVPFTENSLPSMLKANLGNLLIGFLRRFTNFDYFFNAIDIRGTGCVFPKSNMCDEQSTRLYVVSPLEPELDVGKSSFRMEEIVELFDTCYSRLSNLRRLNQVEPEKLYSVLAAVIDCRGETFDRKVPARHPRRKEFGVYVSPDFPDTSDKMIEEAFEQITPYIDRGIYRRSDDLYTRNRPREYDRYRSGPYG